MFSSEREVSAGPGGVRIRGERAALAAGLKERARAGIFSGSKVKFADEA